MTDYAFPAAKFTLPGDPGKVRETAGAYGRFATAAGEGATGLRGLQVSSWVGSEGDIYRDGVSKLPPDLDTAQSAYSRVATALNGFAEVLDREQRQIGVIRTYAESDWRALQSARSQRSDLKKPSDEDKERDPGAQASYDEAKGGLDRRIGSLEGQWKSRVDAATSARARVDEAARTAGHQIRAAGRISPTAGQNWFQDRWEKTKRAVGDAIDGLKNFLKEHAEFFRGLAKVLRVVGYALMVVGALTTVFFGVGGGLMLIGGGLVAAGDILDKSVDWAEGKISGWDLLKSAGVSILVNVGLGAAGKLAMPLVARVAAPLLAKASPLLAKAAPMMGKIAKLGDNLKIKPALAKVDNLVDNAMNRVVPGWMKAVNQVAFPGRTPAAPAALQGPGVTRLADDAGSPGPVDFAPAATHADDGPSTPHTSNRPSHGPSHGPSNGPAVTHANDAPPSTLANDVPSTTHDDGPPATHVDDGPPAGHADDGAAGTHADDGHRPGRDEPSAGAGDDGGRPPGDKHDQPAGDDRRPGDGTPDDGTHHDGSHHDHGGHHAGDGGADHRPDDTPFDPNAEYPDGAAYKTWPSADHYRPGAYEPNEAPPVGSDPGMYEGARDFADKASADEYGKQIWEQRAHDLPQELKDAGTRYFGTESAAYPMNRILRGLDPNLPPHIRAEYDSLADKLDDFLSSNPLPEDLVVYRSVGLDAFPEGMDNLKGLTKTEDGFMSTALGKVHFTDKGAVMKLRVPAGTPGMYVRPVSAPVFFNEQEMLLGRGLRYRIAHVEPLPDGRYMIEAEILPPAP